MTLNLMLDPETEARLSEKAAQRGQDVTDFLRDLAAWAAYESDNDGDKELTPEDQSAIQDGIRRGLEAEAAGRVRPAGKFFAEMKTRYDIAEL